MYTLIPYAEVMLVASLFVCVAISMYSTRDVSLRDRYIMYVYKAKREVRRRKQGKVVVMHTDSVVCAPRRKLMYVGIADGKPYYIHN